MLKKKKIKPRDIFSGSFLAQGLGFRELLVPREGDGQRPEGDREGNRDLAQRTAQRPCRGARGKLQARAAATGVDLVRGAAANSPASGGGTGGRGQEGRTIKRNRTLNSAVCEVSQENSWDLEPLVRIPECRGHPNSQLGGTEGSAD